MSTTNSIRASENFHIVLWLFKDLCWVQDLKVLGTLMVAPTVVMAAWIAWRSREDIGELLHSLAVVCWILANSTWMLGEFFFHDSTRPLASVFFMLGLGCVAWFYVVIRPRRMRNEAH
jgi:ABC-type Mn2+/Zn2+ transport system permease subunit